MAGIVDSVQDMTSVMKERTLSISLQISLVLFVFLLAIFTYSSFSGKIRIVDSKVKIDKSFLVNALKIGDYFFITKYVAALTESDAVSFAGVFDQNSSGWIASSPYAQESDTIDMSKFRIGFTNISFLRSIALRGEAPSASWRLYYRVNVSYWNIVLSVVLAILIALAIFFFLRQALIQVSQYFSRPIQEMVKDISLNTSTDIRQIVFGNYKKSHNFTETERLVDEINSLVNQILNQQDQIKESEVLRVLNDLSRQVAHDIQSPIGALKSAIGQLNEKPELAERLLLNASRRIEEIAKDLSVEDVQGSKFRFRGDSVNIVPLVKELIIEKSNSYTDIKFNFHAPFEYIDVSVNSTELLRALSNILNNSIEAPPSQTESDSKVVDISIIKKEGYIAINVEDNGCGIPEDNIQKVTEKGFTFGKANGHGQGLSHAKSMMVSLGGQIRIESDLDFGTKVTLLFPLS